MKRVVGAACLAALLAAVAALDGASTKPVYLGARACGACHAGLTMGNQYSLWLRSKHSQAYATLAKPESKRIAQISGLRQEPQQAPICLGCHATAFNAEGWEKDDDFRTEDGVQCEGCHGPGSEYATEEVMRAPEASRRAGLRIPTEQDCMNCHMEKGSHVAVLKSPQIDIKKAWRDIAHPMPMDTASSGIPRASAAEGAEKPGPKYAGSAACGACHRGREMGHQYSVWRTSSHAQAWAALGTARANQIATKQGVPGEPQKSAQCLKCHSTGQGGSFLSSFSVDEGIGCEACHGPGSEYMQEAIMRDGRAATAAGLKRPGPEMCAPCHVAPDVNPFDYEKALKQIAHPTRLAEEARETVYKTPLNLALSPDGREIYVACEGSDSVIVVNKAKREKIAEIPVGGNPADVTFTPDGRLAFVSNRLDDTVSVIDVGARKVVETLAAGDEPHGVLTDKQGRLPLRA